MDMVNLKKHRKKHRKSKLLRTGRGVEVLRAANEGSAGVEVLRAANEGSARFEVLRAASDDGSAIDDVIDILNKLPKRVGSDESCNEEAPGERGERRINLQFSSERRSDEQTAEDSGSKQFASSTELCLRTTCKEDSADGFTVLPGSTNFQLKGDLETVGIGFGTQALGEKDSNNTSAENSVEDNAFACSLIESSSSECAAVLMENEHSTAHDPPEGKKLEAHHISGSLDGETNDKGLLPADGFTMRQVAECSTLFDSCGKKMVEDDDSQVVEDTILFDSRDEKMRDVGSRYSDEEMREDGGLDIFGYADMGDADSDIIYLEGFPSLDEMEDGSFDVFEPTISDDEAEDEGSEQHDGFDENMGEDDACEQPQRMEVDDGSAAFKEIDGPTYSDGTTVVQVNEPSSFEAFLCPEDCERILKLGLRTHVQCKNPSSVYWYDFPDMLYISTLCRSKIIPEVDEDLHVAAAHVSNENSAQYNTHEEKSGGSNIPTVSRLLDDEVEVQAEHGIVREWACVDFSSLSYSNSQCLVNALVNMCITIGMKFVSCPMMLARVKPATFDDIGKTLLDMRKKISELIGEDSVGFLLVILPADGQYDERIKELCEILKFTYELCYPYFYENMYRLDLKAIARQIQYKVVKCDLRLRRLALPLVSEAPTIIFGADMMHCGGSESVATVAASLDWPKFRKYFVMESYQPYGEGIIEDLHNSDGGIMIDYFNSFYKRIKRNPQRIIFFRNGLKKSQLRHICQQEINAIKQACANFKDGCQPRLTYVVVSPTAAQLVFMTDKSSDVPPEADPAKYKFWCFHHGQNISSKVCYRVVHDDNNFLPRELQSLTSKLCTFRHRRTWPGIDTEINSAPFVDEYIKGLQSYRPTMPGVLQSMRLKNGE